MRDVEPKQLELDLRTKEQWMLDDYVKAHPWINTHGYLRVATYQTAVTATPVLLWTGTHTI